MRVAILADIHEIANGDFRISRREPGNRTIAFGFIHVDQKLHLVTRFLETAQHQVAVSCRPLPELISSEPASRNSGDPGADGTGVEILVHRALPTHRQKVRPNRNFSCL